MTVHSVLLGDCLHPESPPAKVLHVAAVGDTAFLSIDRYEQNAKGSRTEIVEEIAVSLPALRQALQLVRDDEEREASRPKDGEQGDRAAKLSGMRYSVTPL